MTGIGVIHVTIPGTNGINTLINNLIKYRSPEFTHHVIEYKNDKDNLRRTLDQTLKEILREGRYAVIHLHVSERNTVDTVFDVASKYPPGLGTPIVYTAHSISREELHRLYGVSKEELNKIGYANENWPWTSGQDRIFSNDQLSNWLVKYIVHPSYATLEQLIENYLSIRDTNTIGSIVEKSHIINNATDIYMYDTPKNREIAREIRNMLKKDFIIIAPYRLERSKGLDLLLEGYGRAIKEGEIPKNSLLILVGPFRESELEVHKKKLNELYKEGILTYPSPDNIYSLNMLKDLESAKDLKKEFEKIAKKVNLNKINILYLGTTSNKEILASLYMISDLTVMPTRSESFGYPLLESIMLGTPAAASNLGGPRAEFIERGYVIPIGKGYNITYDDVKKALGYAYKNIGSLKKSLELKRNEIISMYNPIKMVRRYEALYKSIFS